MGVLKVLPPLGVTSLPTNQPVALRAQTPNSPAAALLVVQPTVRLLPTA
jgi:hypothetical protein